MNTKIKYGIEDFDEDLRRHVRFPPELETDVYKAEFWVEAPYHIVKDTDGREVIRPVNADKVNDINDRSIVSNTYNPFEEPYLFLKAAKVDTFDEESILAFCNEYGLFRNKLTSVFTGKTSSERWLPREIFMEQIDSIKILLRDIDAIQRNDTLAINRSKETTISYIEKRREQQLREINQKIESTKKFKEDSEKMDSQVRDLGKAYEDYLEKMGKKSSSYDPDEHLKLLYEIRDDINPLHDKILKNVKAQDALTLLKKGVINSINNRLKDVFPTMRLGPNGEFVTGYTSNSLLSVIYLQISEMMRKSQPLEQCLHCRSWFVPLRKAGVKFCPSEFPGERSKCQNRYDQMKYKAKRAILSGDKSIEDVCRQTKRSFEEVSSWIEDTVKH